MGAFNLPGLLKAGLTGEAARNLAKDPDQAAAVILHEALEAAGLSHLETEILVRAATGYSTNQLIKAAGLPKMRAPEHAVHRGLTTRLEVISPAARLEPKTTVQLEGVKLDRVDSGRDRAIRAEMERMLTGVRGRADHSSVAVVKTISVRDQRLSIIKPADLPDSNLHPYGAFQQNHEAFLTSDALERLSPAQAAVIFLIASLTAAGVQPNRAEELVLQSSGFTREKLLRALASNLLPLAR